MEQRKEIVNRFVQLGLRVPVATSLAGMSKSTFYYRSNGRKKGKKPSVYTLRKGELVSNEAVVMTIKEILGPEFIDYGYHRTTTSLRKLDFKINHKKVYRLMDENDLLQPCIKNQKRTPRTFVQFSCPVYKHPFAVVEIDIKYIYLANERRNCFLITAIDTFTRIALAWDLAYSMKQDRVKQLVEDTKNHPLAQPYVKKIGIRIRTDNGPQFIAHDLRNALLRVGVDHEFIRPATPQQNAHIESFHSTLQKLVIRPYNLATYQEAFDTLKQFYNTYNNVRIMKAIAGCAPTEFLQQWELGNIELRETRGKHKFFFRERQVNDDTALSREDSFGCIKNTI